MYESPEKANMNGVNVAYIGWCGLDGPLPQHKADDSEDGECVEDPEIQNGLPLCPWAETSDH